VRDPEDGGLGDLRVGEQHVLDLARVDVEAAHQDEVEPPVDEVEVAAPVEDGDVAGGEPALLVRPAGRVRPVPEEQVVAADDHLTGVALLDGSPRSSSSRTSTPGTAGRSSRA
jgi:hypothetical protein